MLVKSSAECSKGSILQYFRPFVIKIVVLSTFEWPSKTGFTVVSVAEQKTGFSRVEALLMEFTFQYGK